MQEGVLRRTEVGKKALGRHLMTDERSWRIAWGGALPSPPTKRLSALLLSCHLLACSNVCEPASPPQFGGVVSCRGALHGYYWDGSACVDYTTFGCEDTPPDRLWPTLQKCEEAHVECRSGR
jgi:hypothetical protein